MIRPTRAMTTEQTASEHGARYEALRSHMRERDTSARHGLAVLLRQGVAAWMEAWSKLPAAPPSRSADDERPKPCPLPDGASAEVVHVLAAMTLGHVEEVHI